MIADPQRVGWWVPRRNFIWGFEIRHGGWYPDYQLRLLKLGCAHYDTTRQVHEIVHLDGAEGWLREPLIHHNYRTMGQFVAKQRQYVALEAEILLQARRAPQAVDLCHAAVARVLAPLCPACRGIAMGCRGSCCARWWPTTMAFR